MSKLLIVESPGKIKKIRSLLGRGWNVKASIGHVRDLPKKSLGIHWDGPKVAMDYEISAGKKKAVADLKRAAGESNEIFLAMDMDREGEAIAWHVGMLLGKNNWPKIKRIAFTEITKNAIEAAVQNPRRVSSPLVNAQQARRAVDRLVGFRVSPLLWQQRNVGSSAGRVQSVAVRLVVEREREIRHFVPKEYWKVKATLVKGEEAFTAELVEWDGQKIVSRVQEEKQLVISSEDQAKQIMAQVEAGQWEVTKQTNKVQQKRPWPPFITSTLQQAASSQLKWSAKQAMQMAQQLYEKGLITYMRTDSPSVAKEAQTATRALLKELLPPEYLPSKAPVYKAKVANAQEAHECIRPTDVRALPKQLEGVGIDERRLYELIWKRFVASQMAPAKWQVVTVDVINGRARFRGTGRRLLFDGWMRVTGVVVEKGEEEAPLLPEMGKGEILGCQELKPTQHWTQAPSRFTEASLIKALEKMGIGRPSTYAAIMENIRRRGYLREEKRKFFAETLGEAQVDFLMRRFQQSFMDYQFTADMEEALDAVARGERSWHEVVTQFNVQLDRFLGAGMR